MPKERDFLCGRSSRGAGCISIYTLDIGDSGVGSPGRSPPKRLL
ncbi:MULTISPECIES: hypothetical protein [unclassified Microcoleus]